VRIILTLTPLQIDELLHACTSHREDPECRVSILEAGRTALVKAIIDQPGMPSRAAILKSNLAQCHKDALVCAMR
jgi:hypothetical protein